MCVFELEFIINCISIQSTIDLFEVFRGDLCKMA